MKNIRTKLLMAGCVAALLAATGCASSLATHPVTTHVVHIAGSGKKLGIVQDPVTGQYSLGYQSIFVGITTVPVSIAQGTNGTISYITPDAVASYEISGQNYLFGKAGSTYTVAVGPNAVQTLLGGQHIPINENIVTGEVVQAASPTTVTNPTATAAPIIPSASK